MPFVNNKKYLEIREAAKNGNEKASMVLQAMRKNANQADVDRLVSDYYEVPVQEETATQPSVQIAEEKPFVDEQTEITTDNSTVTVSQGIDPIQPVDFSADISKDMEGLLDENDIEDMTFASYLSDQKKNTKRANKNNEYFKMYDGESRNKYANDAIEKYKGKFGGLLNGIEKRYKDNDKALSFYSQGVTDSLDDEIELDTNKANSAYNDFTGSEAIMGSFGRHWDEDDTKQVMDGLHILIEKYGKKNVLAALNALKSNNESYKNYMNNKVDTEVGRYSKGISDLLK